MNRGGEDGEVAAAYQQASAVPEPPAAIFSSQHEGEGLAVAKDKCMHMSHTHTCTLIEDTAQDF